MNIKQLLTISLMFTFAGSVFAVTPNDDPPIAVVIKTPSGKKKPRKPKPKVAPVVVECPQCTPTECPQPDECALTVPEAYSKKDNLNLSLALTLTQEKFSGLNQFAKDSWLNSPISMGFIVGAAYYWTEDFSMFTNYSLSGSAFNNAQPGVILVQNDESTSKWNLGARYQFSKYFDAMLYFGLRQDYSLYVDTIPYAIVDEFWHGTIGFGVGYYIWQNRRLGFSGQTAFELYPSTSKSRYSAGMGDAISTELKMTFKYKPEFFVSFKYEFSQTRLDTFTDQHGNYFQFGFGINFKSKVLRSDFWNQN